MTTQFIVANTTGAIVRFGYAKASDVALQAGAGETAYTITATARPDTHYVLAGVVTAKVSLDTICSLTNVGGWLANGVDTISYGTALPNPTTMTMVCSNPRFKSISSATVTDGTITLTTTAIGTYIITIDAFPYLTKVITVAAT